MITSFPLTKAGSERDQAADNLYVAGLHYIGALDEWIKSSNASGLRTTEAAYARHRMRMTATFLSRLFPDRATDLNRNRE
ncbi:MAG TPA: hypothetical protein VFV34_14010 [Blastocatellia bacterium]|nr:hypothetical protein [Blastocatellia bacterium]